MKSLNNRLSNVEAEINRLEREIKKLDLELENNYAATSAKPKFFENYQKLKSDLKDAMDKWEGVQLEIEQFVD